MNFRKSRQKIKIFSATIYPDLILDERSGQLKFKLNIANCLLEKIRNCKATATRYIILCNVWLTFEIWLPSLGSN